MLEKAHAKTSDLGLAQATADCLPFASNLFDLLFTTKAIHHLPDLQLCGGCSRKL
jgi:ubiquinone/menaquinone biosynthesis C-methylase UbiE